mmetsp:Transcript_76283/g.198771  ORF Transcript_76283/g.198771 Transcript_76283/m.198771 type:complete len:229 (-) Transcript_76283:499-1185(-)
MLLGDAQGDGELPVREPFFQLLDRQLGQIFGPGGRPAAPIVVVIRLRSRSSSSSSAIGAILLGDRRGCRRSATLRRPSAPSIVAVVFVASVSLRPSGARGTQFVFRGRAGAGAGAATGALGSGRPAAPSVVAALAVGALASVGGVADHLLLPSSSVLSARSTIASRNLVAACRPSTSGIGTVDRSIVATFRHSLGTCSNFGVVNLSTFNLVAAFRPSLGAGSSCGVTV